MSNVKPMIELDPNPKGVPVLSYNVPEPTSYTGQNFIELDFIPTGKTAKNYFKPDCFKSKIDSDNKEISRVKSLESSVLNKTIAKSFANSIANSAIANARMSTGMLKLGEVDGVTKIVSDQKISNTLSNLKIDDVAHQLKSGLKLNVYKNMFGELTSNYIPIKPELRPRIVLVETYKLSSFLGSYGAGRTLKTFSLLPGEKTKISINTYHKTETTSKAASSILDSFTKESSEDFEKSVASENSAKQNESENFEYHAEAEASASWGWGSAKVSGGIKGGSNSSREEFAKNTQNATSKHANKASAKRDVQINTSSEVKEQSGGETEIVREISNINVSRTLNFVFRQMNQEFISLLHLTDIRLAFFNGEGKSKKEFTLPELDQLIDEFIIDDAKKKKEVKDAILNQLLNIKDYKDNQPTGFEEDGNTTNKSFIQKKSYLDINDNPTSEYYQIAKDFYSKFTDQTGREIMVNGVMLSVKKNVLRTDGVIVDSILGQGSALDAYSQSLQDEAIKEKQLFNSIKEQELKKLQLINSLIENGDDEKAKVYQTIYPCCPQVQGCNCSQHKEISNA
ncbi:hypothetical protein JKA74_20010 [Marivirga sp. S37H4]|uniref:MACPF domain-containing protein n=1 Tax=Marivirga aurantiaca TaxID=2802615 RepID=A0A934X1M8_9BACT|nr:hypothetical protein [Marivirga aurantiaca]MBK6267338.1 hypothetical protein [Marivirga aurantiaca]